MPSAKSVFRTTPGLMGHPSVRLTTSAKQHQHHALTRHMELRGLMARSYIYKTELPPQGQLLLTAVDRALAAPHGMNEVRDRDFPAFIKPLDPTTHCEHCIPIANQAGPRSGRNCRGADAIPLSLAKFRILLCAGLRCVEPIRFHNVFGSYSANIATRAPRSGSMSRNNLLHQFRSKYVSQ
jgi:hypothetical protein